MQIKLAGYRASFICIGIPIRHPINVLDEKFRILAAKISLYLGSIWTVIFVITAIIVSGYAFDFSPLWESRLTSIATISALFILFIIQRSQNHSDKATHLKLDELIHTHEGARGELTAIEREADAELEGLRKMKGAL